MALIRAARRSASRRFRPATLWSSPRRRVTSTHRVKDRRRVGKDVGGHPPFGSVGGIDDEPMLPFDDPQGGLSEERGG